MSHYTQLTREERYQIYALKTAGQSKAQIAKLLGRHKSTIGREMARNCGQRGYRPKQADSLAVNRRQEKVSHRISSQAWARVEQLLREYWSPEQISGWLRQEENLHVSPEWIYQYILRDKRADGDLYRYLRCQKQRKKRYGAPIVVVRSKSAFRLMNGQTSSTNAVVSVIGRPTRSLANKAVPSWSPS